MKKRLLRMLATARMCVMEKGYFGFANMAAEYLLRLAGLGALLMIWRSLFLQGADTGGMTLNQLYVYTILSAVLAPMLDVRTPASGWLHEGAMLSLYVRPAGIFAQLTAHTMGGWALPFLLLSLPVTAAALIAGIDLRPASLLFIPSLALAVSAGFAVDFLFTCLLIRLRSLEWPVRELREAITALLTGQLIPFAALPWGIGRVLALTPFGTLAGAPLAIYTGLDRPLPLLLAQVFWNAALWPLAMYCFAASRERMVSYGG